MMESNLTQYTVLHKTTIYNDIDIHIHTTVTTQYIYTLIREKPSLVPNISRVTLSIHLLMEKSFKHISSDHKNAPSAPIFA
jgi:hypothetical protein